MLTNLPMDSQTEPHPDNERAILRLISHHYGDGGIYVPRSSREREALEAARSGGFVNEEGFLTRKGRHFLARTNA